ncbi:H/ACA snoRNP pseudouridylase subunit [Sporothrix bragantina]|uniref:H/ACA snoRNP pseudouridylase subunit n=1 Tax=Sporothrix bragantina TaxID=671064 RepID=A0ABP0D012_9PEZI
MLAKTTLTAALALLGGLPVASADCTRDALLAAAETYIEAQRTGKTDGLHLATSNFTYRENNKVVDLGKGVLGSTALTLDTNRSTADTVACASYTMLISSSGAKPYVLATQLRHDTGDPSVITMIDTIAATTGSLFFNAKKTLGYIQAEKWTPLATADQPSRDLLKKVGDAYLDMWTDKNAADTIPWGTDCERVEGSSLTRPCGASLPHGGSAQPNAMRRYVIDEVMGSVDVLCAFNSLGNMPDSHEIRVEAGKVKYVHTITV